MSDSKISDREEKIPTHADEQLKGTAVGVTIIGLIIFLLWLIIAYLYVSRL